SSDRPRATRALVRKLSHPRDLDARLQCVDSHRNDTDPPRGRHGKRRDPRRHGDDPRTALGGRLSHDVSLAELPSEFGYRSRPWLRRIHVAERRYARRGGGTQDPPQISPQLPPTRSRSHARYQKTWDWIH